MEDFQLLDSLIDRLESVDSRQDDSIELKNSRSDECDHSERKMDKGMYVCLICGFSERISDGQTYTSHKMYKRANKTSTIAHVLEVLGFDREVIIIADQIYDVVVDENCKRTGNRKSMAAACTFEAFKFLERPVDYVHIYTKFDIKKRSALKGLKLVAAGIAKRKDLNFHQIISNPLTPKNFVLSYMNDLRASDDDINEVLCIYEKIKDSHELNMSRPQSIASGLIYYWARNRGLVDAMRMIEAKAGLSSLTISKKAKLVASRLAEIETEN